MGGGRTIAAGVAAALLIGLLGGCNGSSKAYKDTPQGRSAQAQETAATKAKIAAARRRLALAQKRAAAQQRAIVARRRALAAAQRRRQRASTTTSLPPPPAPTPANDHAAIQRTVDQMNRAFAKSVAAGIAYADSVNYWVSTGDYTSAQCAAFEAAAGGGVVREALAVRPETFQPAPGWRDPTVGKTPAGRIYAVSVDQVETLVPTGEQRRNSAVVHATVLPDGRARLLLRCS